MRPNENTVIEIDVVKMLKAIWRHFWAVIIAMALIGAAGFAYAQFLVTPIYKASTMIYVNSGDLSVGGKISISGSNIGASKDLVGTYMVILNTRGTINEVISEAELNYSYEQVKGMISSSAVDDTAVVKIEVSSSDPAEAELIANTVARVLPARISEIMEGSSTKVVDYAVIPSARAFPSLTRYTAIGILIGAVISCGYIVIRELLDDQVRSEKDLSERYPQLPTLAAIPDMKESGSSSYGYYRSRGKSYAYYSKSYAYHNKSYAGQEKPADKSASEDKNKKTSRGQETFFVQNASFAAREAYKLLRTNLMFSLPDDGKYRVMGVTSALRGDGKSTTSLNLAYSFAETGKRVLLMEADLRLPNLAKRLNIRKAPGLSNVLAGMEKAEKAIQKSTLLDTLDVLVAGDVPPNPAELLGSEQMRALFAELEGNYDYVILDLPPVNAVSDGLVISKLVQGMVLVVRQDYDDYRSVSDAIQRMEYLHCKILGMALTCAGPEGGRYGYRYKRYGKYGGYKRYGYRYGGGYKNYAYGYSRYSAYSGYGYGKAANRDRKEAFRSAVIREDGQNNKTDTKIK